MMQIKSGKLRATVAIVVISLPFIFSQPPVSAAAGTVGTGNCLSTVSEASYFTASTTGNYCLLTFKATASTSTISATWTVPAGVQSIQVLVIGGGGGGGTDIGGGGGGGRVVESTLSVTPGATPTLVAGKGGAPGNGTYSTTSGLDNTGGYTGTSSSFATTTALGGSGAIGRTKNSGTAAGWDFMGWTGGGAGVGVSSVTAGVGGSSFKGGTGGSSGGGGGGGANGTGGAAGTAGGAGGAGITTSFTGTSTCYGGGGGGGSNSSAGSASCGGQGGTVGNPTPSAATPGLGGGGGGGGGNGSPNGGQGGSGAVIVKWLPGQTISFTQLADRNINLVSSASLVATSSSALTVSFASATPATCSVTSTTVNLLAQGTCTITASQAGDSAYQSAVNVSMSFSIGGNLALTFSASTPLIYRTIETLSVNSGGIPGKATFKQGNIRIPGCISISLSAANSYSYTCNWKPSRNSLITIYVTVVPSSSTYSSTTKSLTAQVLRRTTTR